MSGILWYNITLQAASSPEVPCSSVVSRVWQTLCVSLSLNVLVYWSSQQISTFLSDYPNALVRANVLDKKVNSDADIAVGSSSSTPSDYAALCSLSIRQFMASLEITVSAKAGGGWNTEDILIFMRGMSISCQVMNSLLTYVRHKWRRFCCSVLESYLTSWNVRGCHLPTLFIPHGLGFCTWTLKSANTFFYRTTIPNLLVSTTHSSMQLMIWVRSFSQISSHL